jgi:large subunit ribosomal protein L24
MVDRKIKYKIRSGDQVIVISGKDKDKKGRVIKIYPSEGLALVNGVNIVSRHTKPTQDSEGGILKKEKPIAISNLAILDPKFNKPTKVGFKFLEDGKKVRYCKLSGEIIKLEVEK